jgi:uncharacterized membrane protein YeaQ/YmgE (transglycosylase-associated protein family)
LLLEPINLDEHYCSLAGPTGRLLLRPARALCFGIFKRRATMEDSGVGWIAAIIIGGIAGWLAEQFMKSNMGLLMNIVLGIVGAIVANAILAAVGVSLGGWIGYLIAGFIGACILIAVGRMFRR